WLCIYDNGVLRSTTQVPFGGTCDDKDCWTETRKGFVYKSKTPSVDGATGVSLAAGDDGIAKAALKAKGSSFQAPNVAAISGPLIVQLVKSSGGVCWSTTFSAPFAKHDDVKLQDKAD